MSFTEKERAVKLQVADLLDKSADYLDENGWAQTTFHQTSYTTGKTRACAIGAIRLVAGVTKPETASGDFMPGYSYEDFAIYRAAATELTNCVRNVPGWGTQFASVIGWNDHPGRTEDEVKAEFRACAARLRDSAESTLPAEEANSDG